MNEQMKKIAQALSINKENAGLWIQTKNFFRFLENLFS